MEDFKHYPLPPEGVDLMKQYEALLDQMNDEIKALTEEYNGRAKALQAGIHAQMKTLWMKMAVMAGVDAEATWDSPEWHIESRYVESGFAALTSYPRPQHPFAAMMGAPPPEETPPEPEGVPEGETVQ